MSSREPDPVAPIDKLSAALIILGGSLLLVAVAVLVLGRTGSTPGHDEGLEARSRLALIAAGAALVSTAFGFARPVLRLRPDQVPAAGQSIIAIIIGLMGLALDRTVFDWPLHYLPDDPRSQPANVLAAALAGCFMAIPVVFGAVSLFALARAKRNRTRS